MKYKVLVVEDDETLSEMLEYNLARQDYDVLATANGRHALQLARTQNPDLILLDVMLPGMDGFEICRVLRQEMNVPILMLTARAEEIDRVVGLEMGADDYLTKPFSMRELIARVKALLRRVKLIREEVSAQREAEAEKKVAASEERGQPGIPPSFPVFTFDNLTIDSGRREVQLNDQPIRLKPKEFDLLLFLARHQGIALSRDLILERVWGWTFDGNSRTVDVHVRWLREKIEANPSQAHRIVTVRGIGYRFDG